jgi:hypothetical protein
MGLDRGGDRPKNTDAEPGQMRVYLAAELGEAVVTQTKPPYRAEYVGSLPRPDRLMAAREG